MKIEKFEDLECWKQSIEVAKKVYAMTLTENFSKDYALRDQIRRSAISVGSNIAEGFERNGNKEFIRFLKIAKGSCGECRHQIYLAKELSYLNNNQFNDIYDELIHLSSRIGKLITYLKSLIDK